MNNFLSKFEVICYLTCNMTFGGTAGSLISATRLRSIQQLEPLVAVVDASCDQGAERQDEEHDGKEAHWLGRSLERERDGRIRAVLSEGQAVHSHRQADLFLEDIVGVIGDRGRRTLDGSLIDKDCICVTETAKAALELVEGAHGSHIGASFLLILFFLTCR